MTQRLLAFGWACLAPLLASTDVLAADSPQLEWIKVSSDNKEFVRARSGEPFVVWGVNYDHDRGGALLEDYWRDDWKTVVEDFKEIKALGANVVRIHLQLGRYMKTAKLPDEANLEQLAKLLKLAERTGLYIDLTGLGCYHKQDVPKWYDKLEESERWKVQARFWQAVAKVCKDISGMFDDPSAKVRDAALSSGKGRLLRTEKWALLDYGKKGELYDMENDPKQYDNLFEKSEYADTLAGLKAKLKAKLNEIGKNDLNLNKL